MSIEHIRAIKQAAQEPRLPKPRKAIAKVSKKRQKQLAEQKVTLEKDKEFYKEVYAASPPRCQNCECKLPKEPQTFMFHHLLEKRNYPQFRYVPENIMILCLECHSKAETNMDTAPRIRQRWEVAHKKSSTWEIHN